MSLGYIIGFSKYMYLYYADYAGNNKSVDQIARIRTLICAFVVSIRRAHMEVGGGDRAISLAVSELLPTWKNLKCH